MTKDLIPNEVKYTALDGQEVILSFEIVKNLLVHGKPELVSLEEAAFFIGMCKAKGLNPFKKDCYLIKYDQNPAAIIVSIDYYRARAYTQENCQGWQVGVIVKDKEEKIKRTNGLVLDKEELLGAWFEAQPKNWNMLKKHEVNLKGYLQYTKEGNLTKFWKKEKQPTQIMKVAEAQGLRSVWPTEFQKLYIREEIYENPNDINKYSEPKKAIISINDFKPIEEKDDESKKIIKDETTKLLDKKVNQIPKNSESVAITKTSSIHINEPKVSLKELRERIFNACMYLAENDIEGAKLTYHGFADIVNPIIKEDENGDKYTDMESVVAKKLEEISLKQARVVWGKIKKHLEEKEINYKEILNV